MDGSPSKRPGRWWVAGLLAVVALAIGLRFHTLILPHNLWDEAIYVALAYKLDTRGVEHYNLREIDVRKDRQGRTHLKPHEGRGPILDSLERAGAPYLDVQLVQIPYGFPAVLAFSRGLLGGDRDYVYIKGNRGAALPWEIARDQLFSVLPPMLFGVLLVALVYPAGVVLYNSRAIGLIGAFLVAVSPIGILTSQRIGADSMTALFSLAALVLYTLARRRERAWIALGGGSCAGISAIAKPMGGFVAIALALDHAWEWLASHSGERSVARLFRNPFLWLFAAGVLLAAGDWFGRVAAEYGNPFYIESMQVEIQSDWFRLVSGRPWYVYLLGIPYQNPLFVLAYAAPFWLWWDARHRSEATLVPHTAATRVLLLWILVFLLYFGVALAGFGKEHRWFLPVYPAYALVAASLLERGRNALERRVGFAPATACMVVALSVSAAWSVPMGLEAVIKGTALVMRPW